MKKVVYTIVRDEKVFLPIWINYYKQFFNADEIWILDNNTIDGSTSNLPYPVFKKDRSDVNADWIAFTVNFQQHWFLNAIHQDGHPTFDWVLYADVDEIFYHPLGIDKFIENLSNEGFRGTIMPGRSYGIGHYLPEEPDMDLNKPIFEQRKYCSDLAKTSPDFWRKSTLTNMPVTWTNGFHQTHSNHQIRLDPDYTLLHLHCMDYKICNERHWSRKNLHWTHTGGDYAKIVDEGLKPWFLNKMDLIPEDVKKIYLKY